ncbi:hypothetical protein DVA67_026075 [Solirubrobacter sp. CPCC 204708]|uniref:D-glucuronyl C5-epimerase C-terminal domain-containing protein n=1 Tax=Solirubrobacter deserti TaxID=2282478 RepID=A0ABT4RFE9_9ACTN|nr:hypothetical protein [Solirubrobacter deserti]MDA0137249.1 hypothetical protein [Solirubrobacter deserti]
MAVLLLAAPASAMDDAGYFRVADELQQTLNSRWDGDAGYYKLGGGGVEPMANSMLLLTHSVAAMKGWTGPSRNDARARALAARLVRPGGPYVTKPAAGQAHAPGWVNSMSGRGGQHLVFDAEVVDGLVYAYRARQELDLPASTVQGIREAIHRTVRGPFWRWPTIRLNQVNWYSLMYAADATVTGDRTLLRRDMSLQLRRFFAQARAGGAGSRIGNFGPGMRFHYLPHMPLNVDKNVDSAEYANIVLTFTRFYDQARRAGMPQLPASSRALAQQWIKRVISGYWTHSGYMNWDSGLGFDRWHQGKKFGLTQEALIGVATGAQSLLPGAEWARYAKYMLDRGLEFYVRESERAGGVPDPLFFDVNTVPQGEGSARLAVARVMANAARAVDAGMGAMRAQEPPSLYAFDPDIGRLAVTTPKYNTAIVAVNQKAFPYGGLDLARLFDGEQDVVSNIGGRPPASFGLMVRDVAGRRVTASQVGRSRVSAGVRPLTLLRAPSGAGAVSSASVGRAYAGAFRDLRVTGAVSARGLLTRVTHRFTRDWIQTSWTATRRSGTARYTADVLFPSWGGRDARVTAVLRDGSKVTVGSRLVRLTSVKYLWVQSERSGYVVVPVGTRPAGAGVHTLRVSAQSSDPRPGPTAAIQIARAKRFSRAALTVRLAPVQDEAEAAATAAQLG